MENKNLWTGLVVVLVIVAGWLIWANITSDAPESLPLEENTETEVPARNENGTEDRTAGSVNASSTGVTISYANALIKYKDARIQLDGLCQASPNTMTFKNGTTIMIDNRSPVVRSVKVGTEYSVKGYGFKLIELSSKTLPATWLVDCDKAQNVATVLIQK